MKSKFYRKVLKNGMTILFEKRNVPVVSVAFAVRHGGIHEKLSEKGISHFIEHMLYKGTPSRNAKKIAEEIEKNGGELNGFTDEAITAYWCKMPSKHLDVALAVLSDMVKNPLFDQKELEKERKVIYEEMKMRKDRPDIYVYDTIQEFLYGGSLGKSLIGDEKTMGVVDNKKMSAKFEQVYCPNNMILCVVGDADFGKLIKFVEKEFVSKKGKITKEKITLKNNSKIEKRKGIDQANLIFAYHVPLANNKKSHAAKVLSTLTAEGMSSRLWSEIREKRNMAYAVKGFSDINLDYAHNGIYVGTTKENVPKVKKLILDEFKKVAEDLGEEELNSIKEQIIGNYHISSEDSRSQMGNLLSYELDGDAGEFYNFEKNILAVKLKDVKDLANIKKHSFFALIPGK